MVDSISLYCAACGSKEFVYPGERDVKDYDVITCNGCGRQATFAEVKRQAIEKAKQDILGGFGGLFKKR